MVEFRKSLLLLVVLAFVASFASAAPLSCSASAGSPPPARAEGLAEEVGQITINCTGGTVTAAGQPIATINVQLLLNTNVTSKLLSSNGASEALLLIDDPAPTNQVVADFPNTTVVNGIGNGEYQGGPGRPNVFVGGYNKAVPTMLTWLNVPFDPPGTGNRTLRIVNVRANANMVPYSTTLTYVGTISAYLTISGTGAVPLSNVYLMVGYPQKSMTFTASDLASGLLCEAVGSKDFTLQYSELFGTAFRNANSQWNGVQQNLLNATPYNTESMFYNNVFSGTGAALVQSANGAGGAGTATNGTRLRAVFTNVPTGVTIYVAREIIQTKGAGTVADPTVYKNHLMAVNGFLGATALSATQPNLFPVTVDATGTGAVEWEVTPYTIPATATNTIPAPGAVWGGSSAGSIDTVAIAGVAVWTATATVNQPVVVTGGYAPVSTYGYAALPTSESAPRFVSGSDSKAIFQVVTCKTNLLFPYVAYMGTWDSGFAISNTSADIFTTAPQSGSCETTYFGNTAPAKTHVTDVVLPGKTATWVLGAGGSASSYTTNITPLQAPFVGYAIVSCNFQYAHGYAFLTDGNVAQGYLGLVLDGDKVSGAASARPKNAAKGEILSH